MYQLVFPFFLFFLLFLSNDICTTAWRCIFDGICIRLRACSTVQPRATWKSSCCFEFVQHPTFSWVQSCFVFERTGRYISSTMSLRIRFLATDACGILWNNASGAKDKLSFGAFRSLIRRMEEKEKDIFVYY